MRSVTMGTMWMGMGVILYVSMSLILVKIIILFFMLLFKEVLLIRLGDLLLFRILQSFLLALHKVDEKGIMFLTEVTR